jgi:hypothetical protein
MCYNDAGPAPVASGRSIVMIRALIAFPRLGVLIVLVALLQVDRGAAEPAGASRLLFDPSTLEGGAPTPSSSERAEFPAQKNKEVWITPPVFDLPGFSTDDLVRPNLPNALTASKPQSSPAKLLDQGLKVGTFSVGVEAAADAKPRTIFGDEPSAEMNSLIDQRRQRGFAPFIGLSAKTTLQ